MGVRNLFPRKHSSRSTAVDDENETDIGSMTDAHKMTAMLRRRDEFPVRLRIVIANNSTHTKKPKAFLATLQRHWVEQIVQLDDTVDTLEQVELAIRFFPQVLSTRFHGGLFPLLWLSRDLKSVRFVPLLARLGAQLEGTRFHPNERGGMVFGNTNLLEQLAAAAAALSGPQQNDDSQDCKFLRVIQELRSLRLMTKSDVLNYNMIETLCKNNTTTTTKQQATTRTTTTTTTTHFPKQRFLYLVDWNPKALLAPNNNNSQPSISPKLVGLFCNDLEGTQWLFGLAMKYYPTQLGFLFETTYMVNREHQASSLQQLPPKTKKQSRATTSSLQSRSSYSPTSLFEFACEAYGTDKVQSVVNDLVHQQMIRDEDFTRKAVICAAAQPPPPENCDSSSSSSAIVYFLMQTDPSLYFLLLQNSNNSNSNSNRQHPPLLDTAKPRAMVLA